MQGILESYLHLPHPAPTTTVPPQQTTSTGLFSNLKVKGCERSNTNPTADEVSQRQQLKAQRKQQSSQYKELPSAFYTLNSKYRSSANLMVIFLHFLYTIVHISFLISLPFCTFPPLFTIAYVTTFHNLCIELSRRAYNILEDPIHLFIFSLG